MILSPNELARFLAKIGPPDDSGCRLWQGECNNQGYGRFDIYRSARRIRVFAHRMVVALDGEPIVDRTVLHRCDKPPCCERSHLVVGTQADNMADARAKGRMSAPSVHRGEQHHYAKISDDEVAAMRARYAAGGVTQRTLAREYGLAQTTVGALVRGEFRR